MAVRQATAADLEDLIQILIASSNDDPCYPYRFPHKDEYPLQYQEHCQRKCQEYLSSNTVIVYEVANPSNAQQDKTVVAFSVWDQPKLRRPKTKRSQTWPRWRIMSSSDSADDNREDQQSDRCQQQQQQQPADTAPRPKHLARIPSHPKPFAREDRSRAFRESSKAAKASFFDTQYAAGYMFLKILLCHPSHRRLGAGTALVEWGMSVAEVQGVNTALFSSPMGVHIYRKLGFQEIGRFQVKVDGDDEELDIPAMVRPTRSRRGSGCAAEVAPTVLRKCVTNIAMAA